MNSDVRRGKRLAAPLAGHGLRPVHRPRECLVDRLGHALSDGEPFAVVWAETAGAIHFSLRSRPDGMPVNAIAERRGGRGHRHAAVFSLPRDSREAAVMLGHHGRRAG